ncbi:Gfo/Idh/MocA family protein [Massilia endophytica]|uniref:Gfo/Idh/MocA family protein n=1 Tax=Massilia endophytica TaxID=2899220 RepID=UPI001E52A2B6|nr:Gfo/Idh/MocA family oxidoreductase [Massilia endophytica]UGQ49150.1 Gfo/Idh/MocA family oxidoreductase [Massilia endophytica]
MTAQQAGLRPLKIGLVGLGKIAVDQHIPAIRANPNWELVAGCSPSSRLPGLRCYQSMEAMLAEHPDIEAVALCTPPQVRQALAKQAIEAGKHVFLEKPPAATVGEADTIRELAEAHGVTLLAGWHSRFSPAVEPAREWIAQRTLSSLRIEWKENVREWHPGQHWIFAAGGSGIFDPAINSLSILTRLLPDTVIVRKADMHVPVNCAAPIRAELKMGTEAGLSIRAEYDFLETERQRWSIFAETADGEKLAVHKGGMMLEIDGKVVLDGVDAEYAGLYAHFHDLIRTRRSDADFAPMRIVADACMIGTFLPAPAFIE